MKHLTPNKFTDAVVATLVSAYGAAAGSVIGEFRDGLHGTPVTIKEILPYAAVGAVVGAAAALKALRRH